MKYDRILFCKVFKIDSVACFDEDSQSCKTHQRLWSSYWSPVQYQIQLQLYRFVER